MGKLTEWEAFKISKPLNLYLWSQQCQMSNRNQCGWVWKGRHIQQQACKEYQKNRNHMFTVIFYHLKTHSSELLTTFPATQLCQHSAIRAPGKGTYCWFLYVTWTQLPTFCHCVDSQDTHTLEHPNCHTGEFNCIPLWAVKINSLCEKRNLECKEMHFVQNSFLLGVVRWFVCFL